MASWECPWPWLLVAGAVCCHAPWARAANLPRVVTIREGAELADHLLGIEKALQFQGFSQAAGVTLRLRNYVEDTILLAGRPADLFPLALADAAAIEFRKGSDKRLVALRLLAWFRSKRS